MAKQAVYKSEASTEHNPDSVPVAAVITEAQGRTGRVILVAPRKEMQRLKNWLKQEKTHQVNSPQYEKVIATGRQMQKTVSIGLCLRIQNT